MVRFKVLIVASMKVAIFKMLHHVVFTLIVESVSTSEMSAIICQATVCSILEYSHLC
jgi:hypothetical protein